MRILYKIYLIFTYTNNELLKYKQDGDMSLETIFGAVVMVGIGLVQISSQPSSPIKTQCKPLVYLQVVQHLCSSLYNTFKLIIHSMIP